MRTSIRQLYRAEEIDATSVRHLTMATKAQQKTWLALYDDPTASIPKGHQLKAWLFGGASISTSVALFDLESYEGRIVTDLFEKGGYFGDVDHFFAAQMAAIETRKAAYIADGWSDVVIIDPNDHFKSWEHQATPKRKGGRVYIALSHRGEVSFNEGYLTQKEASRVAKGENPNSVAKASRPEISSPMTSYIDLHRHAAVRSALATHRGRAGFDWTIWQTPLPSMGWTGHSRLAASRRSWLSESKWHCVSGISTPGIKVIQGESDD